MAKKIECNFPIIGKVNIYIKNKDLFDFAMRQFKNYIIFIKDIKSDFDNFVTIKTNIKNISFQDVILGREVVFKNNSIVFQKKSRTQEIAYSYNFKGNVLINVDLRKKPLYLLRKIISSKYSLNHILFYQTMLYPIFSLYALIKNYFLVHGSLLKINNKYIVLTGLDGVGKSSLSNELVKNGAEILADNFVLFNGKHFIGLNMPIRLDLQNDTNENVIYQDDNLKEVLYPLTETKEIIADKVYFLSIGKNLDIKQLDKSVYLNWHLINNGAGEILEANLFNLPFNYQNLLINNVSLASSIDYYKFSIPKGKIKEAVKELMCQLNI